MEPPWRAAVSLAAVLALAATAAAVEVLEPSGHSSSSGGAQPKFDAATKQQALDEKAQPTFYYRPVSTADAKGTATSPTKLTSLSSPFRSGFGSGFGSGDSGGFLSGGLSSSSISSGGFSSGLSSGSSSKSGGFSSGFPSGSRLSSSDDFPGSQSSVGNKFSSSGGFSSGPSSLSGGRFSSDSSSPSAGSSVGSSGSSFLSGFFPSHSPFGSPGKSPFRSTSSPSSFTDDDADRGFSRTPSSSVFGGTSSSPTSFHGDSEETDDADDRGAERGSPGRFSDSAEVAEGDGDGGDGGGRYERQYMHTREFRDTTAVVSGSPRAPRTRSSTLRRKRKRQYKPPPPFDAAKQGKQQQQPLRNYGEQQYRVPYTENRDNRTDYKYYEDHGGNDTHREHHYRHVVSYHHYHNATDGNATTTPAYSKDAAYDALRQAKKYNYNVDHVYKDGRYIPIVHRQPASNVSANLSEGDFPDGPHVKHHYYNNEYTHDHRNKSEGPVVRHHYHNKDVKVFYHDHRNKSGSSSGGDEQSTYSPSSYKYSTYSPGKYTSTYSPDDKYSSSSSAGDDAASSEKPLVKHHHHFKEYHYDEKGRVIDPRKYNYSDSGAPSSNASSGGGYASGGDDPSTNDADSGEASGGYATDESRGSYSEHESTTGSGGSGSGSDYSTNNQHQDDDETEGEASPTTRSYYYNSNHHNHYSQSRDTRRPASTRYESEVESTTTPSTSHRFGSSRPSSYRATPGAVGYQVHYRDYGDHTFASKEVNFEDGFSFHKERRAGPTSYLETYTSPVGTGGSGYFSSFRGTRDGGVGSDGEDTTPRFKAGGYRSGLVTRDVDTATDIGGASGGGGRKRTIPASSLGSPSPTSALAGLGHSAYARAYADHTRSLVSRGNIGYILVDPLGELPTIRIHASLVNSAQHAAQSAPFPRYAVAPTPATPGRGFLFGSSDPFIHSTAVTALRRVDPGPGVGTAPNGTALATPTASPTTASARATPAALKAS